MMTSYAQKMIMTGWLIKRNLVCFMHTAKGTSQDWQVPSQREMISEELGENPLLYITKKQT